MLQCLSRMELKYKCLLMEERKNAALASESELTSASKDLAIETEMTKISNYSEVDSISFSSLYQSITRASEGSANKRFIAIFKPVFFVTWGFYLVTLAKVLRHIKNQLSVRSSHKEDFIVNGPETIYTASAKAFQGSQPIRFFGIRFIAIWVIPLFITGTVMEFLFVSPLRMIAPFS